MEKRELRNNIKEIGTSFSQDQRLSESDKIMAVVEQLPEFTMAHSVAVYWALANEVETDAFIKKWSTKKDMLLPVVEKQDIYFCHFTTVEEMRKGAFSISEPKPDQIFTGTPDLIIVPGMAFDRKRNRLGRGKGFYDRYLSDIECVKIGVCLSYQLVDRVPCEAHDAQMDRLITMIDGQIAIF